MTTNTLLDITQEVLSAISGDEVNTIGETTESLQVATIVKRKTLDIWARSHTPEREQLIQLTASGDPAFPVLMYIPDEVDNIQWIKYFNNKTAGTTVVPGYQYVTILPIQQFIDHVNGFNPTDATVDSFIFANTINYPGNFTFYYKDNRQPTYCTIITNRYVIFDSFDTALDSTLQSSKTMCLGQVEPLFLMEDTFVPQLNDNQRSLLLNEAKALAFLELKQIQHPKAEQEIQRQWSALQNNKNMKQKSMFAALPNYGRR